MAVVAARLGQFQQLLKIQVILILHFTHPHAITYTTLSLSLMTLQDRLVEYLPYVTAPLYLLTVLEVIKALSDKREL